MLHLNQLLKRFNMRATQEITLSHGMTYLAINNLTQSAGTLNIIITTIKQQ